MSLAEGLASLLHDMESAGLALAFLAVLAYSLAINGSYSSAARSGAGSVALVAAIGFAAVSSSWMSAIVFLALLVAGVAAFAGASWLLSSALGLGEAAVETVPAAGRPLAAPTAPPVRGLATPATARSL